MELRSLELVVRAASASYANAIHYYWPAFGNNEVAERTLAMHVGSTLAARGFLVYGEVPKDANQKGSEHIDLLAIHPDSRIAIWAEAKRLYSGQKAAEVAKDVGRIESARIQDHFKPVQQFGLVVASTWVPLDGADATARVEGLTFWRKGKAGDVGDANGYALLQTALHRVNAHLGAVVTFDDVEEEWGRQRVLYALWERS